MQVISVISWISILGIFVGTTALVVLLSAFNGLESWVIRLYNSFDSDIRIESAEGKWIYQDQLKKDAVFSLEGIAFVSEILEENCLAMYGEDQFVCTMKGVSEDFQKMTGIDTMMVAGKFVLSRQNAPQAIVGSGVAYSLSLSLNAIDKPLVIYVPKSNLGNTLNPADAFYSEGLFASGVFEIQPEFDSRYVIVPISFAKALLHDDTKLSAFEIKLKADANPEQVKTDLQNRLGNKFSVKDRFEQHELLYRIIQAEKWAVFLILMFILLIAIFNVTGSLTMLVVEKSADIRTLQSIGASLKTIRLIFFSEGILISLIGMVSGLIAGLAIVLWQVSYGMILINEEDPYPVKLEALDFLYIGITVFAIGALAAWFPAARAIKKRSILSA